MGLFSQKLPGFPIGLLRIMFGILWLDAALQKAPWVINPQGQRFGWLSNWIWQEMQYPTLGVYKTFLENVVWPNFTFFGYMSFVVEMALGLSLLLGVCTVLSGLGGALWQCNIALGSYSVPGEWYWIWPLLIAPHLVFALSRASGKKWKETVAHTFQGPPDGAYAYNGMVGDGAGNYFGATTHGGDSDEGAIYEFIP